CERRRERRWAVADAPDRGVGVAGSNDRRLVDASTAVRTRKLVAPAQDFPVQHAPEVERGGGLSARRRPVQQGLELEHGRLLVGSLDTWLPRYHPLFWPRIWRRSWRPGGVPAAAARNREIWAGAQEWLLLTNPPRALFPCITLRLRRWHSGST